MVQKTAVEKPLQCPHCKSEKRVIRDHIRELKADGKISQESFVNEAAAWDVNFFDPSKQLSLIRPGPYTCPALKILWDICADCQRIIIIGIIFEERPFQVIPNGHQARSGLSP